MALVVLLKGVNVGGHRRFRPTVLAKELEHLDVSSVGATGTFVVRGDVTHARLREEIARRLPFEAEIVICRGAEVVDLLTKSFFGHQPVEPAIVRFVSILSRAPRADPPLPRDLPAEGPWLVRILARDGRFVIGLHRRQMKVIGELARLQELFGVPLTTRSWTTMSALGRLLAGEASG